MRCVLPFGLVGIALLVASGSGPEAKEPRWLTDFEQAKVRAQAAGKPIFLVFR